MGCCLLPLPMLLTHQATPASWLAQVRRSLRGHACQHAGSARKERSAIADHLVHSSEACAWLQRRTHGLPFSVQKVAWHARVLQPGSPPLRCLIQAAYIIQIGHDMEYCCGTAPALLCSNCDGCQLGMTGMTSPYLPASLPPRLFAVDSPVWVLTGIALVVQARDVDL